jgi:multisubunit Na+/H+ antiporter MnhF subunit
VTGWYAIFPYFAALTIALAIAAVVVSRRARPSPSDAALAGLAVLTWAAAAAFAPHELTGEPTTYTAYGPVVLILLGFVATVMASRYVLEWEGARSRQPNVGGPVKPSST